MMPLPSIMGVVAVPAAPATYTTWNPIYTGSGGNIIYSNGDLTAYFDGSANVSSRAVLGLNSGKWYFELRRDAAPANNPLWYGLRVSTADPNSGATGIQTDTIGFFPTTPSTGIVRSSNTPTVTGLGSAAGDWIGLAVDLDDGTIEFYVNGVSVDSAVFPLPNWVAGQTWYPSVGGAGISGGCTANFGASPFVGSVPGGFNSGWYA